MERFVSISEIRNHRIGDMIEMCAIGDAINASRVNHACTSIAMLFQATEMLDRLLHHAKAWELGVDRDVVDSVLNCVIHDIGIPSLFSKVEKSSQYCSDEKKVILQNDVIHFCCAILWISTCTLDADHRRANKTARLLGRGTTNNTVVFMTRTEMYGTIWVDEANHLKKSLQPYFQADMRTVWKMMNMIRTSGCDTSSKITSLIHKYENKEELFCRMCTEDINMVYSVFCGTLMKPSSGVSSDARRLWLEFVLSTTHFTHVVSQIENSLIMLNIIK